jgi:hypothetical protein
VTEHEAQRERVEAVYQKWRPILGLDSWEVTRRYHNGAFVEADGRASENSIASTAVRWEYQSASIDFNLRETADLDDEHLEYFVIHECMHILTNEMRSMCQKGHRIAYKHEERVCTMLAWGFMRTQSEDE